MKNKNSYEALVMRGADWYWRTPERARADVSLYVLSRTDVSPRLRILAEDIDRYFASVQTGGSPGTARLEKEERMTLVDDVLSHPDRWSSAAALILCYGESLLIDNL